MTTHDLQVVALAGGVGGAKLASGLARVLSPDRLTVVGNTGDDDTFHGLHVSPDLDTLMYTLAGLSDQERGWGLAGETFNCLDMLRQYDAPAWFHLGDRDIATHLVRSQMLQDKRSLTEVTAYLAGKLAVTCHLVPMSDQPVRTVVDTDEGELAFQEYFVQRRCEPKLHGLRFQGASNARMSPAFAKALDQATALVYCPSNTLVSLGPILAVAGAKDALQAFRGPRIAVSPIIGNQALRGPVSKMLAELGEEVSCVSVARRLAGLCDVFVIHHSDETLSTAVEDLGLEPVVRNIVMESDNDRSRLAREVCTLVEERLP